MTQDLPANRVRFPRRSKIYSTRSAANKVIDKIAYEPGCR
jgi:hypothetical protein